MYREVEEGRRSYRELEDNGIDYLFPLYPCPQGDVLPKLLSELLNSCTPELPNNPQSNCLLPPCNSFYLPITPLYTKAIVCTPELLNSPISPKAIVF